MEPRPSEEFEACEPVAAPPPPTTGAALWEAMLDQMVEAAFYLDMRGHLVRCNRAARGVAPFLHPGMDFYQRRAHVTLFHPHGGPPLQDEEYPSIRALDGEQVPMQELGLQLRNGTTLAVLMGASPIVVAGRQVGALVVAHDVTDRREMEDNLRASEARWRGLLEGAPAVITVLDEEDRIRFVNHTPYTEEPDAYVGHRIVNFVDPAHQERFLAALQATRSTGQPMGLELDVIHADGHHGWYNVHMAPIVERDCQVGIVTVSVDVTARKQAEDDLAEQRQLLLEAEQHADMGSWCMDLRTGRIRWSNGLYRILGYEPDAVVPSQAAFRARLRPEDRLALEQSYAAMVSGELPIASEFQVVWPGGEVRVVRSRGKVERDAAGQPAKVIGVLFDVTQELEVERMKNEFIATVSHELRTPLTAVRAPLTLLKHAWAQLGPAEVDDLLDIAVGGVDRMVRLVNDVLDMQRLTTGRLSIAPEQADARELALQAKQALQARCKAARVQIRVDAPSVGLSTDGARVIQVLTNLLDNALSFSPAGSQVTVRVRRLDGQVRFDVGDRGPGIPADQLENVFERFKQLDQSTTRRKGGTGLGLAISREIVGLLGGRIWAERRRGGGTTFSFVLPC
jgi:PAS domain S-box-containing protein